MNIFGYSQKGLWIAAFILCVATNIPATAAVLSVDNVAGKDFQNTANNPCIISGVNCSTQPATFPYTEYNNTGALTSIDLFSPVYTVGQILGLVGDNFSVGLDVNDTSAAQTLTLFEMYIANVLTDSTSGSTSVPATLNGVGFADYLIGGFTSLILLAPETQIKFRAVMSGLNDGPDKFFLVSSVPLPAAGWLLLSGLGGLVLLGRRRKVKTQLTH